MKTAGSGKAPALKALNKSNVRQLPASEAELELKTKYYPKSRDDFKEMLRQVQTL